MFDTIQIIMDVHGRPIFVLPVELAAEKSCTVAIENSGIAFLDGSKKIGDVEIDDSLLLSLVAEQPQVGIIAWDDTKQKKCPTVLTHVAQVTDQRENTA